MSYCYMTADHFTHQHIQGGFCKFPKWLLDTSLDPRAQILYSLMLERCLLSVKNGWVDEEGRVYIIFTISQMAQEMHISDKAARHAKRVLQTHGLIDTEGAKGTPDKIHLLVSDVQSNAQQGTTPKGSGTTAPEGTTSTALEGTQLRLNNKDLDIKTNNPLTPFQSFAAEHADMEGLADALDGYEEMRRKIKKPMTDRAQTTLLNKLQKEFSPGAWVSALDEATLHNWQSIYNRQTSETPRQKTVTISWRDVPANL